MRLKHRLSLSLTGTTAIALAASFAAVSILVNREETADLDRAVLAQAHTAAFIAVKQNPAALSVDDGQGVVPEIYAPMERFVAIYAPDGAVVSSTKNLGVLTPPLASLRVPTSLTREGHSFNLDVGGHHLRAVVVPIADRREWLLYAVSRRAVEEDMVFLYKIFSVLLVAALGVTALIARWLGGRLSADVDAIATVARQVADGDLTARVGAAARGSTETSALAADLDEMVTKLDRLMAAQRTFISHAAHELRSPLATLRGELQLAVRRPRTAEEYKASIDDALGEVETLATLAEDLLVLARVQRGRSDGGAWLIDAVGDAVHMASGPAKIKTVRVDVRVATDSLYVRGSRADLSRAIRNLIDNAVEHSPAGGTVTVSADVSGGRVRVAVADEGPGVSLEDAPHVFSAFYRGARDQSGETPGAGLGLAIVREIARAFGGDVTLEGAPGGAKFVLELAVADAGDVPPPTSMPPLVPSEAD